jgi:outer membrane protein OmpA-like peptidoglycan-associated protein
MPQRLLAAAISLALISSCGSSKPKAKQLNDQGKIAIPEVAGKNSSDEQIKLGSSLTDIDNLTKVDGDGTSKLNQLPIVKHDVTAVHFDFDSAAITAAELPKVQAMAAFLTAHPDYVCVIKGYSDERGSEEYNRALSERRALAVKDALVKNSAALAPRLSSQSMGEEKATPNGNDAVWSAERKAEFEVLDASKAK